MKRMVEENLPALAGLQTPDHRTITDFRDMSVSSHHRGDIRAIPPSISKARIRVILIPPKPSFYFYFNLKFEEDLLPFVSPVVNCLALQYRMDNLIHMDNLKHALMF